MANFLLIAICIIAGMLFRKYKALPADAHKGINAWIIYLALPAVSFKYLPHIEWSSALLLPALGPLLVWLGAWVYIQVYATLNKLSKPTIGALKLTAGLANTSFVGFPLIMAWFSEKEIATAIICDQVTFFLLSTAGLLVAMNSSDDHVLRPAILIKKLLTFPPFIGCIAALTIPLFVDLTPLDPLFNSLAGTVGPLALFSIGLQLKFSGWKHEVKHIRAALFYKLLLAPLLVLLLVKIVGGKGLIAEITVFEAAMPTLLSTGIVAEQYNTRPELANLVIGIGILLSFLSTAGWYYVIGYLL